VKKLGLSDKEKLYWHQLFGFMMASKIEITMPRLKARAAIIT